jgi:hypothetical protein
VYVWVLNRVRVLGTLAMLATFAGSGALLLVATGLVVTHHWVWAVAVVTPIVPITLVPIVATVWIMRPVGLAGHRARSRIPTTIRETGRRTFVHEGKWGGRDFTLDMQAVTVPCASAAGGSVRVVRGAPQVPEHLTPGAAVMHDALMADPTAGLSGLTGAVTLHKGWLSWEVDYAEMVSTYDRLECVLTTLGAVASAVEQASPGPAPELPEPWVLGRMRFNGMILAVMAVILVSGLLLMPVVVGVLVLLSYVSRFVL